MARWPDAALILLIGCAGREEAAVLPATSCAERGGLDWDNYGEGFFRSWCTSCHASTAVGLVRSGAPEGLDFDTWEGVVGSIDAIRDVALGEAPTMPPLDGVTEVERGLLADYLDCGADIPPQAVGSACAAPRLAPGPVTIRSAAEAEALCATAEGIDGALTLSGGAVALDCLCTVAGDVEITDAVESATFAALTAIGGDLTVHEALDLHDLAFPELDSVAGGLTIANTGLEALAIPDLETVAAGVALTDNPALATLSLFRLRSIGGDLHLQEDPALTELGAFEALEFLGGSLTLTALGGLDDLGGFERLTEAGSVSIASHPRLTAVSGFSALATVHGPVRIAELPSLARIDGFDKLTVVEGDLTFATLPALVFVPRLDTLVTLTGALEVTSTGASLISGFESLTTLGGLRIADQPVLAEVVGFGALPAVDGALLLTGNPALAEINGMLQLVAVHGDLQVAGTTTPLTLGGLDRVTQVDGALRIQENQGLTSLAALTALEVVGGDLVITDNPVLPSAAAFAVLDAGGPLDVGGVVTIIDNGP